MLSIVIAFAIRLALVGLFFPFSALDKVLDFEAAVAQARESCSTRGQAIALIAIGLFVEVFMSLAILTGICDRLGAFVLSGYCVTTALLWKAFWKHHDFWSKGASVSRGLFWDFWKNVALAGGFLLITFGTDATSVTQFIEHPFSSTHPYAHPTS